MREMEEERRKAGGEKVFVVNRRTVDLNRVTDDQTTRCDWSIRND